MFCSGFFTTDQTWANPIPELELMGKSNSVIWIAYFFRIGIDKFGIGIEVCYKKFNSQINLPFNILIKEYVFHDNLFGI